MLGCLILLALGIVLGLLLQQRTPQPPTSEAFGEDNQRPVEQKAIESIADMAERVMPSVVPVTIEFTM